MNIEYTVQLFFLIALVFFSLGYSFENSEATGTANDTVKIANEVQDANVTLKSCGILKSEHNLKDGALTDYWAQEMIGSDLLNQDTQKAPPLKEDIHLVSVWDGEGHGDLVAHLISGKGPSASLPPLTEFQFTRTYIPVLPLLFPKMLYLRGAEQALLQPPSFINSSMGYDMGYAINQTVYRAFSSLASHSILITSAGNKYNYANPIEMGFFSSLMIAYRNRHSINLTERYLSQKIDAIVVGSFSSDGLVSSFSQEGKEVWILAPADDHILSADKEGVPQKFSHTSAATPLVTVGLAGFEWISGWHPTAKQAKMILEKTAIPTIHSIYESPQRNGRGLVNLYKLGQSALQLANLCDVQDESCLEREVEGKRIYQFSPYYPFNGEENFQKELEKHFPQCAFHKQDTLEPFTVSCEEKEKVFHKTRKAALLNPFDTNLWKRLACIYESNGYPENALGLSRLGTVTSGELEETFYQITPEAAIRLAGNIGGETGNRHLWRLLNENLTDSNLVYGPIPYAAGNIGGKKGEAIVQHILGLTEDSSLLRFAKQKAAHGLGENGQSGDFLSPFLKDPDPEVRSAATYAKWVSGEGDTDFFENMFQDEDINVKKAAVYGAGFTNEADFLWQVLDEAESFEEEEGMEIKLSVLHAVESLSDKNVSNEFVLYMTEDTSPRIRGTAMAIFFVEGRDNDNGERILEKWMRDPEPLVRSILIQHLVAMNESDKETATSILDHLLSDPDPAVKAEAVSALSIFSEEEAAARLIQMEKEETHPRVRAKIAKMIPRFLQGEDAESLLLRLSDPKEAWEVRYEAAMSIARIGGSFAESELSRMGLEDTEFKVRRGVAHAIEVADMEEEAKGKILLDMTQNETNPKVKSQLISSVSQINTQEAEEALRILSEDEDPEEALRILSEDEDPEVRRRSLQVLQRRDSPSAEIIVPKKLHIEKIDKEILDTQPN